ncbi:MAG: MaoC/PaaZ C-terminal domain-containing protein [Vicinamibacterales bacterium]
MRRLEAPQQLREWVGGESAVSDWMLVGQDRIDAFARVIDDEQWIHVDVTRARRVIAMHGAPVAHGFLVLSLASSLFRHAVRIDGVRVSINYGLNRVRFVSPLIAGGCVRGRFTPLAVETLEEARCSGHLRSASRRRRLRTPRVRRGVDRALLPGIGVDV